MNQKTYLLAFCGLAVAINVLGGSVVSGLKIPLLFLDAVGTIFVAVVYGPAAGFLVGLITNLVLGVTTGPTNIPFGLVNGAIGLVVGYIARYYRFNLVTAVVTGVILAIVAPLIGTPIAVAVFGGLTGGGMDVFVLWLQKSGAGIFAAAFVPRVISNLVDKILCCVLIAVIIQQLPKSLLERIGYEGGKRYAA
ncbi:MAG: transporter component [Firmicutes bacterium]|nr:transporter component [Bacillota bacterium]